MSSRSAEIALLGENLAADYLVKLGYRLVKRNFRCRYGEIDIICEDKESWIFVEVKARRSTQYGMPAEAVNYRKQQKIISTAMAFVEENRSHNKGFRFDVVEVYVNSQNSTINHIIDAFGR